MKISVITVCLNAKCTIKNTLLSIFNQTYKNIELVVIDGGSIDGTIEIISEFKDKITHFISEPDKGIYDAMNKGIKLATGDFLIFLNADDTFYDDLVVKKVVNALSENQDAKMLFGDVEYISNMDKNSHIQTYENTKNDFSLIINNICHQCIFYHKSLFEEFGLYSKQFKIYADWGFNIKCLVENRVFAVYLPITISKFQLGGICSDKVNEKICKSEKKALIEKYYKQFGFIILANEFLRKMFGQKLKIIYRVLINISFAKQIATAFCSKDKYKLNVIRIKGI